jgi:hypothetical protein
VAPAQEDGLSSPRIDGSLLCATAAGVALDMIVGPLLTLRATAR